MSAFSIHRTYSDGSRSDPLGYIVRLPDETSPADPLGAPHRYRWFRHGTDTPTEPVDDGAYDELVIRHAGSLDRAEAVALSPGRAAWLGLAGIRR